MESRYATFVAKFEASWQESKLKACGEIRRRTFRVLLETGQNVELGSDRSRLSLQLSDKGEVEVLYRTCNVLLVV